MSRKPYIKNEYKVMCDICGSVRYASETCMNWKNQRVCKDSCLDIKNRQDEAIVIPHTKNLVDNPRPLKVVEKESLTDWSKI